MNLIHAFQEDRTKARAQHIKFWFGIAPLDEDEYNPEDGSYIVCYCGARVEPLEGHMDETDSALVWHLKTFKDIE